MFEQNYLAVNGGFERLAGHGGYVLYIAVRLRLKGRATNHGSISMRSVEGKHYPHVPQEPEPILGASSIVSGQREARKGMNESVVGGRIMNFEGRFPCVRAFQEPRRALIFENRDAD